MDLFLDLKKAPARSVSSSHSDGEARAVVYSRSYQVRRAQQKLDSVRTLKCPKDGRSLKKMSICTAGKAKQIYVSSTCSCIWLTDLFFVWWRCSGEQLLVLALDI